MNIADVQDDLAVLVFSMADKYWPNGYNLSEESQDSYPSMLREYMRTGRITIWTGASDNTIFGHRDINWEFRAWHDYWHIRLNADFSHENECIVMRRQQLDAYNWCRENDIPKEKMVFIINLLEAEIKGQGEYMLEHGEFPVDQVKFTEDYIERMKRAADIKKYSIPNAMR